jgi:hypothetical protein
MRTAKRSSKPTREPWKPSATIVMPAPPDGEKPVPVRWEEATELEVMRAAINEDDPGAADKIRRRSAGNDDELIRLGCGNLSVNVRWGLIQKSGRNEITREAIGVLTSRLADMLRGPKPSVLEKLLVTRIVACWLDLQRWEEIALRGGGDVSIRLVEHWGKA